MKSGAAFAKGLKATGEAYANQAKDAATEVATIAGQKAEAVVVANTSEEKREEVRQKAEVAKGAATAGYAAAKDAATEAVTIVGQKAVETVVSNTSEEKREDVRQKAEAAKGMAAEGLKKVAVAKDAALEGIEAGRARAAAAASAAYDALPEEEKEKFLRKVLEKKEALKAKALEMSGPVIDKALDIIKEKVKKAATSDPAMFEWARRIVGAAVDDVWIDVKIEASDKLRAAVLQREEVNHGTPPCCGGPGWVRAWTLHHFIPHDKAIWGQLRDPGWWALTLLTMLPVFAVRTIFFSALLLFIAVDAAGRPDEFQLVKFVMRFKGMAFVTGGLIAGLRGGLQYYGCVSFPAHDDDFAEAFHDDATLYDNMHSCEESAPGVLATTLPLALFELFGGVLVVWIALALLPFAVKHNPKFVAESMTLPPTVDGGGGGGATPTAVAVDVDGPRACCGCGPRQSSERGGRLMWLLYWDVFAFMLALGFLGYTSSALPVAVSSSSWQFQSNVYWANVVYSLLAFPFFPFQLPVLNQVLTHAEQTGYNQNGRAVPFKLAMAPLGKRVSPTEAV